MILYFYLFFYFYFFNFIYFFFSLLSSVSHVSGNFSIRFWRQHILLFASIAAIVVPIVDLRQKKFPLGRLTVFVRFRGEFWCVKLIEIKGLKKHGKSTDLRETHCNKALKIETRNQNKTSKQWKLTIVYTSLI